MSVRTRTKIAPAPRSVTLVYRPNHPEANENGMVDKDLVNEYCGNSAPYVISDCMSETRHMADGKIYTSKAAFRAATKANGCVEVGNEVGTLTKPRTPIKLDRRKRREDIKRTLYEARNRA